MARVSARVFSSELENLLNRTKLESRADPWRNCATSSKRTPSGFSPNGKRSFEGSPWAIRWTSRLFAITAEQKAAFAFSNEAIDQAIAESIGTYAREVRQTRDRFLAILGHDLRTPVGAIVTTTQFMLDTGELPEPHRALVSCMEATGSIKHGTTFTVRLPRGESTGPPR